MRGRWREPLRDRQLAGLHPFRLVNRLRRGTGEEIDQRLGLDGALASPGSAGDKRQVRALKFGRQRADNVDALYLHRQTQRQDADFGLAALDGIGDGRDCLPGSRLQQFEFRFDLAGDAEFLELLRVVRDNPQPPE